MNFSIKSAAPENRATQYVLCVDGEELPIFLNDQEATEFEGRSVEVFRLISVLQHPTTDRANTLLDWLKHKNQRA